MVDGVIGSIYASQYANQLTGYQIAYGIGFQAETDEERAARLKSNSDLAERLAKMSDEMRASWADAQRQREIEVDERNRKVAHKIMMFRIRNKDSNMATRVERRRKYLREKWQLRGKLIGYSMIALPLAVGGLALLWRFALWTIFS